MTGTELAGDVTMPGGAKVPKKVLVIGGAAAAAFVAWRFLHRAPASDVAPDDSGDAYGLTGGNHAGPSGVANGSAGPSSASPYGATDPSELPPSSNGEWVQRATSYLTALGWDPETVSSALGRWMTGDWQEGDRGAVEAALGAFGRPPQTAPPLPAPKKPTPTTPAGKSAHQLHEDHLAHVAHVAAQARKPTPAPKPVPKPAPKPKQTVPAPKPRPQPVPKPAPKPVPKTVPKTPAPTTRNVSSKTIAKRGK